MSDVQMVFVFCLVYSGALSVVIFANWMARKRQEAPVANEEFPLGFDKGA